MWCWRLKEPRGGDRVHENATKTPMLFLRNTVRDACLQGVYTLEVDTDDSAVIPSY
jgi:hypothetical protein